MNRTRVEQILRSFNKTRILILGDVMLDEFIWGKVVRISPEAPVPVVEVVEETYRLGGAANVAATIRTLEGVPIPIGIIGVDAPSQRIKELLQQAGIESQGLLQADRPTTLKSRIIAHNQQVVRTDRESKKPLSTETNTAL